MFDLESSIQLWLRLFRKHQAFNHGSVREMELHLRDHIDDLIAQGHEPHEAFEKAVESFGEIQIVAKEELWNQKKKTQYTILNIIMLNNYFQIALRNMRKHKFYAMINIIGLTMGLSIVMLIGLFVSDELSFDQFHIKKDQLYRVVENQYYAGQEVFPVAVTPTALGPSLLDEYPEVVNFTRLSNENFRFELGEKKIRETGGIMVDDRFFKMFSFPLVSGSLSSFKEQLNSLLLSEELADKYFPDQDPVGKSITLSDEEFQVLGVFRDVPNNSHLDFKYVINFENYITKNPDRANSYGSNWLYTYVELDPQANLQEVNEKVIGQIKKYSEGSVTDIYLQPLTDIYLGEVDFVVEVDRKGEMMYVRIFAIVAIFILLISCINFMNLSTARSAKRAKEVGLRKTIGASRKQLILQFLSESVLLSFSALVIASGVVALVLPAFNQLTDKSIDLLVLLDGGNGFALAFGLLVVSILTGLLAGSYPAIYLSSIRPIHALQAHAVRSKRQRFGLRRVLVVLQFVISVILIIGTLVVYQQLDYIQNIDLGYNRNHILYTYLPKGRSEVFAAEVRKQRGVLSAGRTNRHPSYVLSSSSGFGWPGKDPSETILLHNMGMDEHYSATMEMKMVEGRSFVHTDSAAVIINEKAREVMGLKDPVGQSIDAGGDWKIVGVVKNFNFKSIHTPIEPLLIFNETNLNRVFIRFEPGEEGNIVSTVSQVWDQFFPDREFDFYFLDEDFDRLYAAEARTSKLATYFAVLAVLISCLGLFGLVSYATEQRTKEIGIRKALGASVQNLFLLLTYDFTRLVLFSLVVSIPLGWYVMSQWLENYAYRIDLSIWVFAISATLAMFIALVTVSYQSIRASVSNPVQALRDE